MELLVSDPWAELVKGNQSGCEYREAEAIQPLALGDQSDPGSCLRSLRSIWTAAVLSDRPVSLDALKGPFRKSHPLIEALSFLLLKKLDKTPPPRGSYFPAMPIGEMCQLALLWSIAGEEQREFAQKILPFHSFPSLWCPESSYSEKEALWSIALLLRSFGKFIPIPENPDPYFIALAKLAPQWEEKGISEAGNAILYRGAGMAAAIATAGEGIPLGALRSGSVEVPAFGPQAYPLNDPKRFGIRRSLLNLRWAAAAAKPEVWFEAKSDFEKGEIEIRFIGLSPESPLAFAFYVKADSAQIGEDLLKPKCLHRYVGEAKKVVFERGGSRLSIENAFPTKMEAIPLAGEGCFWNAEFLLAFEVPPFDGRVRFKLDCV